MTEKELELYNAIEKFIKENEVKEKEETKEELFDYNWLEN